MDFLLNWLFNTANINTSNPFTTFWWFLTHGGFIFILLAVIIFIRDKWLDSRQTKFAEGTNWIFLAIDVPRDDEQSPKAVEQIFNQLSGAASGANWHEKWWKGKFQTNFSLELVSIEGYIQYIIRTPKHFRDLVEASIYAQYPEAQITEIEDYTLGIDPETYKEKGYKLWGAQFKTVKDEVYPIKTYPLFEHSISQKIVDPIAAILEIFARLGRGEQAWLQILILPVADKSWKGKVDNEVKKIMGKSLDVTKNKVDKILDVPGGWATKIGDAAFGTFNTAEEKKEDKKVTMFDLTPGQQESLKALERKGDKVGFKTKIRYIYLGTQNSGFSKPKGVSGFTGALKQFALLDGNGFRPAPGTVTKSDSPFPKIVEKRVSKIERTILKNYKSRSQSDGTEGLGFILNTEELATLYHFPFIGTPTSSVKTTDAKKSVAPMGLPFEDENMPESKPEEKTTTAHKTASVVKKEGPPENLPI
jgi:hypothetical protein